jgi:glucose 1-dehydrogenase
MALQDFLALEAAPVGNNSQILDAGIRVNALAPGAVRTQINAHAWNTPQAYADLMTLVPYKRIGEPEDIAEAAVWLASDQSDYMTGTTLFIDGGMTLYPGFESGG